MKNKNNTEFEALLDDAIGENFDQIENKEIKSSSFLKGEGIGLNTLACIVILSRNPRRIRMASVGNMIKMRYENIEAEVNCNNSSLIDGSSGYLYSLLILEKALRNANLDQP